MIFIAEYLKNLNFEPFKKKHGCVPDMRPKNLKLEIYFG